MDRKKNSEKNVCIAKIVAPHGIRGLVKIIFYTDDPANIASYGDIFDKTESRTFQIQIKSQQKQLFLTAIAGVEDRTAAEELAGLKLYVARDSLPEPEEENFYINDLLNMDVHNTAGELIGTVENIENFGAGDIIEIKFKETNKTQCYSFTKQNFPHVDVKNRNITFSAPRK